MMEKNNNNNINNSTSRDALVLRTTSTAQPETTTTTSSDFVLQWGNRKRLRCMKVQGKDPVQRTTSRIDQQKVIQNNTSGYLNLRQRPSSPAQRVLRNSESSISMKGQSNGARALCSPERVGGHDKKGGGGGGAHTSITNPATANNGKAHQQSHVNNHTGGGSMSPDHDSKKGGSSSGSDAIPAIWPPKFVIALTNKEKEEDFYAFKGSKLPQRPKKRAKFIQRTLHMISPGTWLSELTLDRYEVREKKVTKKRPRGLKAMGNMESDSE